MFEFLISKTRKGENLENNAIIFAFLQFLENKWSSVTVHVFNTWGNCQLIQIIYLL